jgi:hypothetical protein
VKLLVQGPHPNLASEKPARAAIIATINEGMFIIFWPFEFLINLKYKL